MLLKDVEKLDVGIIRTYYELTHRRFEGECIDLVSMFLVCFQYELILQLYQLYFPRLFTAEYYISILS